MNLKIGGSNVGKIMYGGQEFGGATKLEPGTILYLGKYNSESFKDVHLLSTTKKWENINGINIVFYDRGIDVDHDIVGDDFKSLDTGIEFDDYYSKKTIVSRSIVDGEYRLNISANNGYSYAYMIRAI